MSVKIDSLFIITNIFLRRVPFNNLQGLLMKSCLSSNKATVGWFNEDFACTYCNINSKIPVPIGYWMIALNITDMTQFTKITWKIEFVNMEIETAVTW